MAGLKRVLCDSLRKTIQDMFGVCERVVEHARFSPDAIISAEMLDLFKFTPEVTQEGGLSTSAPNSSA